MKNLHFILGNSYSDNKQGNIQQEFYLKLSKSHVSIISEFPGDFIVYSF